MTAAIDVALLQLVKKDTANVNVTVTIVSRETDKTASWMRRTVPMFTMLDSEKVVFTL